MNGRLLLLSVVAAMGSASCGFAQAAPPAPPMPVAHTMTPTERSNRLARTGGTVQAPAKGPAIVLLNTQKRVPVAPLQEVTSQVGGLLSLRCEIITGEPMDPIADAAKVLSSTSTAVVIVICDVPNQPALLVAPENRWALVNVAPLATPNVSAEKLAERTLKETWRGLGYLMGSYSSFENCLMKPVFSPADLDALVPRVLSPEPFMKIGRQGMRMGMVPVHSTSYRKAVEEGWAPAPTNDIQRAIWQELKK